MLIERSELTSGSSWHAAGGLFTITRPNTAAPRGKFATFTVNAGDCAVWGDEAILLDNQPVGYVTWDGLGPACKQHIALGYVNCDAYRPGGQYAVEVLGQLVAAQLQTEPLYDPTGANMRA